jgi:hypothetical protein
MARLVWHGGVGFILRRGFVGHAARWERTCTRLCALFGRFRGVTHGFGLLLCFQLRQKIQQVFAAAFRQGRKLDARSFPAVDPLQDSAHAEGDAVELEHYLDARRGGKGILTIDPHPAPLEADL